jgi:small-conductance mechanosensitive channel
MQQLALALAGVVAPFLIQLLRKYLGEHALKDWVAQAIVLAVSIVLALFAGLGTGELSDAKDVLGAVSMVFAVATVVYKSILQDRLDDILNKKNIGAGIYE